MFWRGVFAQDAGCPPTCLPWPPTLVVVVWWGSWLLDLVDYGLLRGFGFFSLGGEPGSATGAVSWAGTEVGTGLGNGRL